MRDEEVAVPKVLTAEEQVALEAARAREAERLANEVHGCEHNYLAVF